MRGGSGARQRITTPLNLPGVTANLRPVSISRTPRVLARRESKLFPSRPDEIALFKRSTIGGANYWLGRRQTLIRKPATTIFANDAYETVTDGNGDTFDNWYQWANPDRSGEYLRHMRKANVLFADTHVAAMTRAELADMDYYIGR